MRVDIYEYDPKSSLNISTTIRELLCMYLFPGTPTDGVKLIITFVRFVRFSVWKDWVKGHPVIPNSWEPKYN